MLILFPSLQTTGISLSRPWCFQKISGYLNAELNQPSRESRPYCLEAVFDSPHAKPARNYPKRDYKIKIITPRERDKFCLAEWPQVSKLGTDALMSYARVTLKVVCCVLATQWIPIWLLRGGSFSKPQAIHLISWASTATYHCSTNLFCPTLRHKKFHVESK